MGLYTRTSTSGNLHKDSDVTINVQTQRTYIRSAVHVFCRLFGEVRKNWGERRFSNRLQGALGFRIRYTFERVPNHLRAPAFSNAPHKV